MVATVEQRVDGEGRRVLVLGGSFGLEAVGELRRGARGPGGPVRGGASGGQRGVRLDLRAQLDLAQPSVLPKSTMGKAIQCVLNQWDAQLAYTTDGRFEIDNNAAQRALRPIAAARKGWQYFLNENGGEKAAVHFSLITTANAAGLNPVDYLRDVLVRMDFERDWENLLPHAWGEHFADEVAQRREAAMRELGIAR